MLAIILVQSALADHWRSFDYSFSQVVVVPEDLLVAHGHGVFGADESQ